MSDVSKLKINNVTYNIKDSLALRDAPSDGEEYVRKNGAWEISSGGGSDEGDSIVFGDDSVIIQPGEGVGFYGDAINFENGSAIITTSERTIKNLWDIVADSFTTTVSYSTDDYVIHEENLYQFITDHPAGEWNDEDVVVTTIEDGLNSDSGGNSGGEGGKAKVMYFYEQTVNTATNAEIFRVTDPRINTDTVVLECTFANPEYITGKTSWISYEGYIAFTGTCTTATTANITLAYKTEENISNRLLTLLWENPNPTSAFTAQTISLDLSQYDMILFSIKHDLNNANGYQYIQNRIIGFIDETITLSIPNYLVPDGLSAQNVYVSTRKVTIGTSGITFGSGYNKKVSDSNVGTVSNTNCIPLKIYGISKYTELENLKDTNARASIADNFDVTKNYNIGDLALYDGLLYQFTSQHETGAWDSSHVTAINLAEMVKKKLLWHNTGTTYANTSINITGALSNFLLIEYITSAYSSLFRETKTVVIGEPFFLNTIIIPGSDPSQTVFYGREFSWSGTTLIVKYGSSRSVGGSSGKDLTTACVPINIYSLYL